MLITKDALLNLQTTFSAMFQRAWLSTPVVWPRMATMIPSSSVSNTYGAMARLPAMREWLGPRLLANIDSHAYTLVNRHFELTVGVSRDDIEDDQLGWTSPLLSEFGRQAAKWPDQLARDAMQAGTTDNGFDGVPFFATTHDLDPAGNQSNNFTTNPLTAANYATTRESMMAYTGEDGQPLGVMPDLLIVPPQLESEARTILNADIIASGSAGVSNVYKSSADLLVMPELSGEATTWYLADSSRPLMPLIWQVRKPVVLTSRTSLSDENVFTSNRFEYGIDGRGAVGYGPWFLMSRNIA